jgi:SAM-dependent methyltransferase
VLVSESEKASDVELCWVSAKPDALPIAAASQDVVILPHLLEFESSPQGVLEDARRILKPEGRLFILGFNPWSPSGLLRGGLPTRPLPWHKNSVGLHQLMAWLNLLKFEAELSAGFSLSPDCDFLAPHTLYQKSMACLTAAYAVKAIKRTYTVLPLRDAWADAGVFIPAQAPATLPLFRKTDERHCACLHRRCLPG